MTGAVKAGTQVRDYIFREKIGEGGMGEVWKASHVLLETDVAIKVVSLALAEEPSFGERFLLEARTMAKLSHPRILSCRDFFCEGGRYYLVMPLFTGRSLEEILQENAGGLPAAFGLQVAADLLEALEYAHSQGVVHRDIKPSNVLIDDFGHATLTDFGIALLLGGNRLTSTGLNMGSPWYMSPEQIITPRQVDARADIYGVGCLLYEIWAGEPPFCLSEEESDSHWLIQAAHVHKTPLTLSERGVAVPLEFSVAVAKALQKSPEQRFCSAAAFRAALFGDLLAHGSAPEISGLIESNRGATLRVPFFQRFLERWRVVASVVFLGCAVVGGGALVRNVLLHKGQMRDDASQPTLVGLWAHDFWQCALFSDVTKVCWGAQAGGGQGVVLPHWVKIAQNEQNEFHKIEKSSIADAHELQCELVADGAVKCWGNDAWGVLGREPTDETSAPEQAVRIGGLPKVAFLSVGKEHACAADVQGHIFCWGSDRYGQLGTGAARCPEEGLFGVCHGKEYSAQPVRITLPKRPLNPPLER